MSLADFVHLEGYKVTETYKHLDAGYVLIAVESAESEMVCKRCNTRLEGQHGKHRLKGQVSASVRLRCIYCLLEAERFLPIVQKN
jgi:RNase P subunit RPR2